MKKILTDIIRLERSPRRGLLAMEWAVLAYLVVTLAMVLFAYTRETNPESMVEGRLRILATVLLLWAVYRLLPCRLTMLARVVTQIALLAWWYPDTYEINRMLPNMDHVFAQWEQTLFGCQPALLFAAQWPHRVVSELMSLGYAAYYPMIAVVVFVYFFSRYEEFGRCAAVIITSFFAYYLVFDLLPVVGPTFYYRAVGTGRIAQGVFPELGTYFDTHRECLPTPGYTDGFFYHMVQEAKAAGERPTAAFPSSHVGVSTVCMLLLCHIRAWRWLLALLPIYLLLCMATVYIQAHYLIDALAGLATGVTVYALLMLATRKLKKQ